MLPRRNIAEISTYFAEEKNDRWTSISNAQYQLKSGAFK